MAEGSSPGRTAVTGFERYETDTLLRIHANLRNGSKQVAMSEAAGTLHVRPKPGAATPSEAGFTFVALLEGINHVLASRGIPVVDSRNPYQVQAGQIWQDNDARYRTPDTYRFIKVLGLDLAGGKALVETVTADGAPTDGRQRSIKLTRFLSNSTGYLRRADLDR